jgi:hypothetical protein
MSQDGELRYFKWFLGACGTFLISGCFALDEARYLVWGKIAEGRVRDKPQVVSIDERHGNRNYLGVNYTFRDEISGPRSERDLVPPSTPLTEGQAIPIQYIPSEEKSSRLAGNRSMGYVYTFLACLAVMAIFIYKLAREANEPVSGKKSKKEKGRP